MKKFILFICLIAIAITISSCRKRMYYYQAYCEKNHALWEGPKREWGAGEDRGDTKQHEAQGDAFYHNDSVHGGMGAAEVRSGTYVK